MHMTEASMPIDFSAWTGLGVAIVEQAIIDWRTSYIACTHSAMAQHKDKEMLSDCESFFRGPYPEIYTGVQGKHIIKKLKGLMKNDQHQKRSL